MNSFPLINRPLSELQNRVLAVFILVILVLGLCFVFITPLYLVHRHYDDPIEQLSELKQRYDRLILAEEDIEKHLSGMRGGLTNQFYLQSNVPALAAAEIQALAKKTIESNGGKLATMSIVPFNDEEGYREVAVSVQFASNIRSLRQILYVLESGKPFLFVDNATFRSITKIPYIAAPGVEPQVAVQLDLIGYARVVQ
jgi:general secretion pathway protein M